MSDAYGLELVRSVAWRKSRYSAPGDGAACLQATDAVGHPDGSVTKDVEGVTVVLRQAVPRPSETEVLPPPPETDVLPPATVTDVVPPPPASTGRPERGRSGNNRSTSSIRAFLDDEPRPSTDHAAETVPETPSTVPPLAASAEKTGLSEHADVTDTATAEPIADPAAPQEWLASSVDVPAVRLATERFDPAYEPPSELGEDDAHSRVIDRVAQGRETLVRANVRKVRAAGGQRVREFTLALPVLAGDLPLSDVTALQTRMQGLLDTHLNGRSPLPRSREQLHVWVVLTPVRDHGEAIVLSASDRPGPADQLHLDLNHDDGDLLHEMLHYLGVRDAGQAGWSLFRRTPGSRSVQTTGVMADTNQDAESLWVLQHYLKQIEEVSDAGPVIPEGPLPAQAHVADDDADFLALLPETAVRVVGEADTRLTHLPSQSPSGQVDWTIVSDWLRESGDGSRSGAMRDLDAAVARLNDDRGDVVALRAVLYAIDEWRTSKSKPSRRDTAVDRLETVVDAELTRLQGAAAGGGRPATAGNRPVRIDESTMTQLGELENRYFRSGLQPNGRHPADTAVTTHVDGDTFFGAIAGVLDTLGRAGDRLYITSWYFHQATRLRHGGGETKLVERLTDLIKAGVDVRIVVAIPRHGLSPFQKAVLPADFWRWPMAAGIAQYAETNLNAVRALRGIRVDGEAVFDGRVLIDWGGGMDSRHEKSTIAYNSATEELHAFVGGMDYAPNRMAEEGHSGTPAHNYWHDVGVQLQGGAAADVLRNFWTRWDETSTLPARNYWYEKNEAPYNPSIARDPEHRVPENVRTPTTAPAGTHVDTGVRIWRSYGPERVSPLTDSLHVPWGTLPAGGVAEFADGIVAAIDAAQRYIYVEDQTLNPSFFARMYNHHKVIFPAISRALARGVKVVFVTQGFAGRGSPSADATPDVSSEINSLILKTLSPAQRKNFALHFLKDTKIHSKLVLVDDQFASIGSANFWDRSAEGDESEVTAAIVHPGGADSLVGDLRVQLWREHLRMPDTPETATRLRDLDISLGYFHQDWGTGTTADIPASALVPSRPGLLSRLRVPVTTSSSQGGAAPLDPAWARLPLGAPMVVDAYAPGTADYARRHGGNLDARMVREVASVPKSGTGTGGGKAKEEPLFTRRLLSGTSEPWVSYSVVDMPGGGAEIILPGGRRVPGEGWLRHGPLFVHPGDGQDDGWVLYGDTGWIGRLANSETLFSRTQDAGDVLPGGFDPATAPGYRVVAAPTGVYLAPVDAGGLAVHLPWEESIAADGTGPGVRNLPGFGLGGVPAGVGWAHARWAHSWELRFDSAGAGTLYAAMLAAAGGSIVMDGHAFRDPDELRQVLSDRMRVNPPMDVRRWPLAVEGYRAAAAARLARASGGLLSTEQQAQVEAQIDNGQAWLQMVASVGRPGHWDELADVITPLMVGEYLGTSLLVLHADGGMTWSGSGRPLAVARITGPDGTPRWAGMTTTAAGPVLGGLSAAQVGWAAGAGMRFAGPRGGSDFLDALVAAGRALGTPVPLDDPKALRSELARRMQADTSLTGSEDWAAISAEYARAAGDPAAGDRRPDEGEVLQEIIAAVKRPDRAGALGGVWPLLAHRYLGTPVHVLEPGGQVRSYGEGPGVTVAAVTGGSWAGLAPVEAPRVLGAGTRPADVAGGWSAPVRAGRPADTSRPQAPAVPAGPVPAGLSAAQQAWALGRHRRFVEVPGGADAFFTAVLQAADGSFTADGVLVGDAAHLRNVLVDKIRAAADTDLGLWLVVHTIYAARFRAAVLAEWGVGSLAEDEARVLAAQIDERIDGGQALEDILSAIADPGFWPELAEELAPYFLNLFRLAVRVVDADGVVGRYGQGRPVYVAPVTEDGLRRWVALPPATTRFAAGSALGAPNVSDPVLVQLAQAVESRKTGPMATGAPADPVLGWLRDVRTRWSANGTGQQAPAVDDAVQWDRDWLETTVAGLGAGGGLSRPAGAGVSLALAVELAEALFPPERGGIRPAPDPGQDATTGRTGPLAGISAEQWVMARSLREVVDVVPSGGAALFLHQQQVWVVVDTTSGLRLVEFGPDEPAGRISTPSPAAIASMDWPGIALVIDSGQVVPAAGLGGSFAPAAGWDAEAFTTGHPSPAVPRSSVRQDAWAREHTARLVEARPGANAFFEAVITAAGGGLTVNGEEVTDATKLRQALAAHVRAMAAPGALRKRPLVSAAFAFEAEGRVVEEFLGHDLAKLNRRAVHDQIGAHLDSGAAARYVEQAIAQPGHWEQIVQMVAPDLLAELAGLRLLVLDPDGRVHGHGDPAGRRLIVARTAEGAAVSPGWAAVVPETPEQGAEPFGDVPVDVEARSAGHITTVEEAVLNDLQRQVTEEEGLRVELTEPGADSFYSAVLAAAGGGVLLDRETFVDTPAGLRHGLARLVRERPDVLDEAAWRQLGEEDLDTEKVVDALTGPAGGTDGFARHLIGLYLGELRVIEPDGTTSTHGTGRPITIAPTTGEHGGTHWAALVPPARQEPLHDTRLPGLPGLPGLPDLPGLPEILDFDQPLTTTRWDPDHYKLLEPGAPDAEDPWRNSTFCVENEDGVLTCVTVAVITRDHPLAQGLR